MTYIKQGMTEKTLKDNVPAPEDKAESHPN